MASANDMASLARLAGALLKSLMEQDFTREEAVQLVASWLQGYCTR